MDSNVKDTIIKVRFTRKLADDVILLGRELGVSTTSEAVRESITVLNELRAAGVDIRLLTSKTVKDAIADMTHRYQSILTNQA